MAQEKLRILGKKMKWQCGIFRSILIARFLIVISLMAIMKNGELEHGFNETMKAT